MSATSSNPRVRRVVATATFAAVLAGACAPVVTPVSCAESPHFEFTTWISSGSTYEALSVEELVARSDVVAVGTVEELGAVRLATPTGDIAPSFVAQLGEAQLAIEQDVMIAVSEWLLRRGGPAAASEGDLTLTVRGGEFDIEITDALAAAADCDSAENETITFRQSRKYDLSIGDEILIFVAEENVSLIPEGQKLGWYPVHPAFAVQHIDESGQTDTPPFVTLDDVRSAVAAVEASQEG